MPQFLHNKPFHYSSSYGTDTSATLLDDVDCSSSSYLTLQQCTLTTTISLTCTSNSEDAYVVCCKSYTALPVANISLKQILQESGAVLILDRFVCKVDLILVMDDWRFIVMDSGGRSVMILLD